MPCYRVHMEGLLLTKGIKCRGKGRGETSLQGQEQQKRGKSQREREKIIKKRITVREWDKEMSMEGSQGTFKREISECA